MLSLLANLAFISTSVSMGISRVGDASAKLQVTIGFLRDTGTDPSRSNWTLPTLEKQLDHFFFLREVHRTLCEIR